MRIKLFTMVKNEDDIIENWINYHGKMFGYNNLHIIDNYSDDDTYDLIMKYKDKGVHIYRERDYRMKGILITQLINNEKNKEIYHIAIPLDIDEFITYYDKDTNQIDPSKTKQYICSDIGKNLNNTLYKCNYIESLITSNNDFGYKDAISECEYGKYLDYGNMAKTFINIHNWNGQLDHGNHCISDEYFSTELVLVHYHCRNIEQMKKKISANVTGLGYKEDAEELKKILEDNHGIAGNHHIKHMIKTLENKFTINTNAKLTGNTIISLKIMNHFINN